MVNRLKIGFLIFFFVSQSFSSQIHEVKKGESLSDIAGKYIGTPIYFENGSLKKLLKWNLQIENPNFIKPGETIIVSSASEDEIEINSPQLLRPSVKKQKKVHLDLKTSSLLKVDLALGTSFFSILSQAKSDGRVAYFYSDSSIDVASQLNFQWEEGLRSSIGSTFSIARFFHNGPQAVENQQISKLDLFTGIMKSWNRFSIGSNIIYSQNFFIKSRSLTVLEIVKNPTMSASIFATYLALKSSQFSLSPGFELQTIIPVDFLEYSYNKGNKWKASLTHRRDFKESSVGLTLFYSVEKYETQEVRQKERQLSLMVDYQF